MTDHPITPPHERFKQWEDDILNEQDNVDHVLDCAWRDGFLQGLEACIGWLALNGYGITASRLRAAMLPEPPSLKELALARTDAILNDPNRALLTEVRETLELNRRALEALPDA